MFKPKVKCLLCKPRRANMLELVSIGRARAPDFD